MKLSYEEEAEIKRKRARRERDEAFSLGVIPSSYEYIAPTPVIETSPDATGFSGGRGEFGGAGASDSF